MTSSSDPDRRIRAFIAEGDFELPDRSYDAIRAAVDASRPRGALGTRRIGGMGRFAKLGVAAAVALSIGAAGLGLLTGGPLSPSPAASPSQAPSPRATPPIAADPEAARTLVVVDDLRISLHIPAGWETFGPDYPNYASKSRTGPQGAEAQVLWAAYPALGISAGECFYLRDREVEATVDALAAAVSSVPGTLVASEPAEVTVGGHRAIRVVFVVQEDVGCDPGFFFTYPNLHYGALWPETMPGHTVRVWIVEASPRLLFLEGKTHPDAGPVLEGEIQQIVDSIAFE
jgi:hypothetical protein